MSKLLINFIKNDTRAIRHARLTEYSAALSEFFAI